MKTTYDVDYFLRKFSAIPEERWCEGMFVHPDGRRCALGHCGVDDAFAFRFPERNAAFVEEIDGGQIRDGFDEAQALRRILDRQVGYINNGQDPRYRQPTPRARILAALHDIKSKAEQAMDDYETRPLIESTRELVR